LYWNFNSDSDSDKVSHEFADNVSNLL